MLGGKAISLDIAVAGEGVMPRPEAASVNRENHVPSASAFSSGALSLPRTQHSYGMWCSSISMLVVESPDRLGLSLSVLLRQEEIPKAMSTKSGSVSQTRAKNAKRTSKRSTTGRPRVPEAASRASYPLAIVNDTWASSSRIKVEDVDGTNIISIPFEFLSSSQECSWKYIHYLISESVEEPGDLWHSESNTPVDIAAETACGHYTYIRRGKFQWDHGARLRMAGIFVGRTPILTPDMLIFRSSRLSAAAMHSSTRTGRET